MLHPVVHSGSQTHVWRYTEIITSGTYDQLMEWLQLGFSQWYPDGSNYDGIFVVHLWRGSFVNAIWRHLEWEYIRLCTLKNGPTEQLKWGVVALCPRRMIVVLTCKLLQRLIYTWNVHQTQTRGQRHSVDPTHHKIPGNRRYFCRY